MKVTEFIKDRISFVVAYFLSNILVIIIMYFSLMISKNEIYTDNIPYAFIVSFVLFILFMVYDYYKQSSYFKKLKDIVEENESLEKIANLGYFKSNEQKIYSKVLFKLYESYMKNINVYEDDRKQYIFFVNEWVHQMKTPVSVINLLLQDNMCEEFREIFDSIAEENEKLSQGLELMLYNARASEFSHDFKVESISLEEVVRSVINANKKAIIRNHIFPKIVGGDVKVDSDKKWLYFVINQITINAIKYTKIAERDKKNIIFTIEEKEDSVVLSIEDNGIGIAKEDLGRVFDAFFTGKNGRTNTESTGMGMYLAKRICDGLQHSISVKSEEGTGTFFYITFFKGKNIFKI